nr:hypothetical protein [Tanacetum cinerariifolium]
MTFQRVLRNKVIRMKGRGVKEKSSNASNIEVVKDGVVPFVTLDSRNVAKEVVSPSVVDETVAKEKKRSLVDTTLGSRNGIDVVVVVKSIRAISELFANTAYGFSWRSGWPILVLLTMFETLGVNTGLMDGLDAMLKNGPWFIRNNPLILRKWHPDVNLMKKDV